MTTTACIKITDEQKHFLNEKPINFSKFVRNALDNEMNKSN